MPSITLISIVFGMSLFGFVFTLFFAAYSPLSGIYANLTNPVLSGLILFVLIIFCFFLEFMGLRLGSTWLNQVIWHVCRIPLRFLFTLVISTTIVYFLILNVEMGTPAFYAVVIIQYVLLVFIYALSGLLFKISNGAKFSTIPANIIAILVMVAFPYLQQASLIVALLLTKT
jgi:hypothetical protein